MIIHPRHSVAIGVPLHQISNKEQPAVPLIHDTTMEQKVQSVAELSELASAMEFTLIAERKESRNRILQLVKHLPMKLRVGLRVEVLCAAVEAGFLTVTAEGKLAWMLESKTLLAYFCGRMWCGDTPYYNKRAGGYVWMSGGVRFPKKDLVALFGVENLRTLRSQRCANVALLPAGWELVERIFGNNDEMTEK